MSHHPDLHSFPTRRSSDLVTLVVVRMVVYNEEHIFLLLECRYLFILIGVKKFIHKDDLLFLIVVAVEFTDLSFRSEEHTSELQSRENLVCRLLLEKKN